MILVDMYRAVLAGQENSEHRHPVSATIYPSMTTLTVLKTQARSAVSNTMGSIVLRSHSTSPGELPPPPPKACFGRDELIERIIGHAENHTPIALIGAGGIGKTSVALVVLHHDRIKERFGRHRRFIRCDQFPASHTSFLNRLSKVIGAGVENPEDLTPLRSSLSSNEMFIVLDNAESILDPRGANSQDIYGVVEELSRLNNICLCITSRITTIPPDCKCLGVPALSMDAAHNAFYRIYDNGDRPDLINDILGQLDFHPLSITLLATVAYENKWDSARLTREWERRQTNVLQTEHNKSLAAAIELSLASPTFQELGPDTRELLGVVAFFPQGVDEKNLDWLFPTSPNSTNTFDKFCILSLTYRSNGFVTMLAPFRDYFSPKDPKSSPLLCRTKERYFTRMSVDLNPDEPGFEEARWIASEDVNVEHLLDVFTSIDADSDDVWDACANFTRHLYRHKMRLIVLRPKIEGLGDGHPSKPQCLYHLALLFGMVGNHVELKRLLTHTLKLERERGNDCQIAETLRLLSEANQLIGLYEEGIRQARESLEISERLRDTAKQGRSLDSLAWLLWKDDQLDAAEEAEFRAINLLSKKGHQYQVCQCHQVLGHIYRSKGNREKAIYHFEVALGIASTFDWHDHLFRVHYSLALLFAYEDRLDDAHAHIEQAKSHAADNAYYLGLAMEMQAKLWYEQHQFKEAKSDVLRAVDAYEKVGAATDVERCRELLQKIQKELNSPDALDFRR